VAYNVLPEHRSRKLEQARCGIYSGFRFIEDITGVRAFIDPRCSVRIAISPTSRYLHLTNGFCWNAELAPHKDVNNFAIQYKKICSPDSQYDMQHSPPCYFEIAFSSVEINFLDIDI